MAEAEVDATAEAQAAALMASAVTAAVATAALMAVTTALGAAAVAMVLTAAIRRYEPGIFSIQVLLEFVHGYEDIVITLILSKWLFHV